MFFLKVTLGGAEVQLLFLLLRESLLELSGLAIDLMMEIAMNDQ